MAPFTAWLPVQSDRISDLVVKIAGGEVTGLINAITAMEHALSDQGYEVMAQSGGPDRRRLRTVRLRVSTEPISSIGSGCDVLAYVDREVPKQNYFGLQQGSVLLHEACNLSAWPAAALPKGVITYPIPFSELNQQCGPEFSGKGLIATGVLAYLLGISEEAMRRGIQPAFGLRYFDAGVNFASTHLQRRDICAVPALSPTRRQVMLDTRRALELGMTLGSCKCGPACAPALDRSPDEWMAEHTSASMGLDSFLMDHEFQFVRVYRKPNGRVIVLIGVADPTTISEDDARDQPVVLVASDMLDIIQLVRLSRRLAREEARLVWVVTDEILANRQHSIPIEKLVEIVRDPERTGGTTHPSSNPFAEPPLRAERVGEIVADVGYVAWGAAQGVVREAVALCRGFDLKVAALYPKVLRPVPNRDLEAFAATVKSLVIVEPDRAGRYTKLVRASTSVRCTTLVPESRWGLTPMDIFLSEGLGTYPRTRMKGVV